MPLLGLGQGRAWGARGDKGDFGVWGLWGGSFEAKMWLLSVGSAALSPHTHCWSSLQVSTLCWGGGPMLMPIAVTDQMADGASRLGFCKLSKALWAFWESWSINFPGSSCCAESLLSKGLAVTVFLLLLHYPWSLKSSLPNNSSLVTLSTNRILNGTNASGL